MNQTIKDFKSVIKLFHFQGIRIVEQKKTSPTSKCNFCMRVIHKLLLLSLIFCYLYIIVTYVIKFFKNGIEDPFVVVPFFFNSVLAVLMWLVMYAKRCRIRDLLDQLDRTFKLFEREQHHLSSTKWAINFSCAVTVLIVLLAPIAKSYLVVHDQLYPETENYLTHVTLSTSRLASLALRCFLIYLYNVLGFGVVLFIPCAPTLLQVHVSVHIARFLKACRMTLPTCMDRSYADTKTKACRFSLLYSEAQKILPVLEKALGLPMLLLFTANLFVMYSTLAYAFGMLSKSYTLPYSFHHIASSVFSLMNFFAYALPAAEVWAEDHLLRRQAQSFVLKMQLQGKLNIAFILRNCFENNEPIRLSLWETFYFDRVFILSVLGGLLTYGLLILQLKDYA